MIQIDRYTVSARFLPAAVIVMPLALAVFTWAPFEMGLTKGAAAVLVMSALAYVLSHPTRDAGRELEERLWPAWGGAPSITMLRHRDAAFDPVTKARFHKALVALKAVPSLPTAEAELLEPGAADHAYAAVSIWLRGKTRDRKAFPLVFEENVNYGYQRNLLACRPWGLAACAVGVLSGFIAFWYGRQPIAEIFVSLLLALYLVRGVSEAGLRRQADTYARRLIEATDDIASAPKQPLKRDSTRRKKDAA